MEESVQNTEAQVEMPQAEVKKPAIKFDKKKMPWLIGGVAAVIVAIVAIVLLVGGSSTVTCTMQQSISGISANTEIKMFFNHNGYAVHSDVLLTADLGDNASDAAYKAIVRGVASSYYLKNKDNITDNIEAGHTSLGNDTKITRDGSKVIIKAVRDDGKDVTATQAEIDETISSAEKSGYTCNR